MSPDWSDEHVSRANRFAAYLLGSWVVLVVVSVVLGGGLFAAVVVGILALWVTWLLVHSLFTEVDELVKTRIAEAEGDPTGESD